MDFCQLAAFSDHAVVFGGDDLGADRSALPIEDFADSQNVLLKIHVALFGDERRIGRHAVEYAQTRRFTNLFQICGIDKELHFFTPPKSLGASWTGLIRLLRLISPSIGSARYQDCFALR